MIAMYLISGPVWLAAFLCLGAGLYGIFSSKTKGEHALVGLFLLPVSSGIFYIAAMMCALV